MKRTIALEDLVKRATGHRKFNRHKLFRPSLAYYLVTDPFWIWCTYHAPKEEAVDESTRYDELRMRQGIEFEEAWVKTYFGNAVRIEPGFGYEALKNTIRAMLHGAPAIYQPQLWDLSRESYGKGDLLVRDDSAPSDLGPFHYRVIEIKRSKSLQAYHALQAAYYNQFLGLLQGYDPPEVTIALKDSQASVPYLDQVAEMNRLRSVWRSLRDDPVAPETRRPPDSSHSPWRFFGNKRVIEQRDLVLLAGIQRRERAKLRRAGIHRVDQLWNLTEHAVSAILGEHYGAIAFQVARAYKIGGPVAKPGQSLNIPRAKRLLYFDFETSDSVHPTEPPHTYLIGCYDANRDQFVKFLARGAEDEARIFDEFLDYAGDLRDTKLYHWTDFEIREMLRVTRRWPWLAGSLASLMECCVDLKTAIQSALYLPVPNFSIKSVAPALGFRWRQKEIGAYQSMVCYWDYLDNGDLLAIGKAIAYNEDDCMAMWHVDQALERLVNAA